MTLMRRINAQTVNSVNAKTGNRVLENTGMARHPAQPASAFWRRLEEALRDHPGWPRSLNPNNVATKLDMSQGSVYRWFLGTGLPELKTALYLSKQAGVCVDWLLNDVKPKYPISRDPLLRKLFEICEELPTERRERVLEAAAGQRLLERENIIAEEDISTRRA